MENPTSNALFTLWLNLAEHLHGERDEVRETEKGSGGVKTTPRTASFFPEFSHRLNCPIRERQRERACSVDSNILQMDVWDGTFLRILCSFTQRHSYVSHVLSCVNKLLRVQKPMAAYMSGIKKEDINWWFGQLWNEKRKQTLGVACNTLLWTTQW